MALLVTVPPALGASADSLSASQLVSYAAPQLGFGGYTLSGHVTQISASWRVPKIFRDSKSGSAATWIGAQDRAGDFIQIGTTEDRNLDGSIDYQAFWSDAPLQFVPQDLGEVKPGDLVSVSMTQKGFGWTIRASDPRSSLRVDRQIEYGFEDRFTLSEWVQENPSSYTSGLPTIPYPDMGDPTFSNLSVNRAPPALPLDDGLTLITSSGHFRVPSPVAGDAFTFHAPTDAQDQFLSALSAPNAVAVSFGSALSNWAKLSATDRRAAISQYRASLTLSAHDFTSHSWPRNAQATVQQLANESQREARDLSSWSATGARQSGSPFSVWLTDEVRRQSLANRASAILGLPPSA